MLRTHRRTIPLWSRSEKEIYQGEINSVLVVPLSIKQNMHESYTSSLAAGATWQSKCTWVVLCGTLRHGALYVLSWRRFHGINIDPVAL